MVEIATIKTPAGDYTLACIEGIWTITMPDNVREYINLTAAMSEWLNLRAIYERAK